MKGEYFNPRPPRGGRPVNTSQKIRRGSKFQSTSSARRTTVRIRRRAPCPPISIHVLREEDDLRLPRGFGIFRSISIHVLREEDDSRSVASCNRSPGISIHVLREEDDQAGLQFRVGGTLFQSTSSARRTTSASAPAYLIISISIHVLREEDDTACSI